MRRRRARNLLDRTPQHLPMPIGDLDVVHRRHPLTGSRGWWSANATTVLTGIGLLAAAGGGVLGATGPAVVVGLDHGGVRLGESLLRGDGTGGYGGGDAPAMVIAQSARRGVLAAANGIRDGMPVRGRCELHQRGMIVTDRCTFNIGALGYRADDVLDLRGDVAWHRRYGDGQRVVIHIPPGGAVTPVPFPIGKP